MLFLWTSDILFLADLRNLIKIYCMRVILIKLLAIKLKIKIEKEKLLETHILTIDASPSLHSKPLCLPNSSSLTGTFPLHSFSIPPRHKNNNKISQQSKQHIFWTLIIYSSLCCILILFLVLLRWIEPGGT